jgi:hypothetical protein
MRRTFLLVLLGLGAHTAAFAQPLDAETVLRRSLAHHDPAGVWSQRAHRLTLRETRPDAPDRHTVVLVDAPAGLFAMTTERDGRKIEARLHESGECVATIDGSILIAEADRDRYRLDCVGIAWWRGYQEYLYGLPMKLRDPGTRLDPDVVPASFNGQDVLSIRVTYDPAVGSDVWYFYFDPASFALVGARFYHDEAKNDGEYLFFEEEIEAGGITLPRIRAWYYNNDDRHLATDYVEKYEQVLSGRN